MKFFSCGHFPAQSCPTFFLSFVFVIRCFSTWFIAVLSLSRLFGLFCLTLLNNVPYPKNLEPRSTTNSPAPIKSTAFKCKHCKAIFKEYYLLENHFKSAHALVKVPDRNKEKHFKSAHADVKVPDSNKFTENKQTPLQTNKMKTNEPNDGNWKYKCGICEDVFDTKDEIRSHRMKKHLAKTKLIKPSSR